MLKWNLFQSADGAEREVFPKIICLMEKGMYILKWRHLSSSPKDMAPLWSYMNPNFQFNKRRLEYGYILYCPNKLPYTLWGSQERVIGNKCIGLIHH